MKKALRKAVLFTGIATATAFGGHLAFAAADAASAPAQEEGHHDGCNLKKGHHGQRFLKRLEKKLGLSAQQKTQVDAIFKKRHEQVEPMMAQMMKERGELRKLIYSGSADERAIRAQSGKVSAVEADLAVQRAQGAKELMAVLTPEQQTKFTELQEKFAEKMHKRFEHERGSNEK